MELKKETRHTHTSREPRTQDARCSDAFALCRYQWMALHCWTITRYRATVDRLRSPKTERLAQIIAYRQRNNVGRQFVPPAHHRPMIGRTSDRP